MEANPIPVRLQQVTRRYGDRTALDKVDFEVQQGEIIGLVGPNGSGKTTLLKILAGLLRPSSGSAAVWGQNPFTRRAAIMARTRFAFFPQGLYESLSPWEHLLHLSRIHGKADPETMVEALDIVGLEERKDDRVGTFSTGMRQRLVLAQALIPRPDLLVLDEPTDGLDPLAILELREVLKKLRKEFQVTIVLSSHLLIEVDELVDRLLILSEGKTLFWGTPQELTEDQATTWIEVDDVPKALALLQDSGVQAKPGRDLEEALLKKLREARR